MARIEITPRWAKLLDFETRVPSAVEELARQAQSSRCRLRRKDARSVDVMATELPIRPARPGRP